jgi:hypothetical protein
VDSHRLGSQFWNSIQKVKSVFSQGAKHQVRNGASTRFWDGWWQGQGPLKDRYPTLYAILADPHVTVADCCSAEGWHIDFRRGLGARERVDLTSILAGVTGIQLSLPPRRLNHRGSSRLIHYTGNYVRGPPGNTLMTFGKWLSP